MPKSKTNQLVVYKPKQVSKYTKPVSRRNGVVAKRNTKRTVSLPGMEKMNAFPPTKYVKLIYNGVHTLTVGATGTLGSIQKYNLNSLNDPDATNAGHQPYTYDQLTPLYQRYKVLGCTLQFRFSVPSINNMSVCWMVTNPAQTASTIAALSPYTVQERSTRNSMILNTNNKVVSRKFFFPCWKVANVSKLEFDADPDNFTADYNTDPANKLQFQMAVADLAGGSSGTLIVEVKMTYYAQMYQNLIVAGS